jgi:hypothetical protein
MKEVIDLIVDAFSCLLKGEVTIEVKWLAKVTNEAVHDGKQIHDVRHLNHQTTPALSLHKLFCQGNSNFLDFLSQV